ncbi:zinc-ribbon domain-containing protein [Archangium violaceum]|uniref:OB-fold protein n=1 Tax=Archangium violaceum TaxID=83451 RepID=UPI00194F874C|nr:zinc-ribbon domain-containing protein [Archangium violaceum]QRN97010.1 zinc-ribbon domain-containing protein [Archangium violaceum]
MALVKCRQCGNEVATNAAACPKCGAPPHRRINFGKLFGIAVVLLVAPCFLAWVMAQVRGNDSAAPAAAKRTVDAKQVEIRTLLAEYTDNEVRADEAFKGKVIQTSGVVGEVKKDIVGDTYVLVGTGRQFELPVLQCTLDSAQVKKAASLTKGARVTVRGRVNGLMMNVLAKDCEIVNL